MKNDKDIDKIIIQKFQKDQYIPEHTKNIIQKTIDEFLL